MKRPEGRNPQLNVYPTSFALTLLAVTAGIIAAMIAITGAGNSQLLIVTLGIGATAGMSAAMFGCTNRVIRKIENHAQRVETSTAGHAVVLSKHILTLEAVFGMGQQSDRLARKRAGDLRPANGTGPFRMFKGDAS